MHADILIRINKVLNHIEEHLCDALPLHNLAEHACLSKFHFHRTFKIITGETPNDYINRKRIEKIASLLIYGPDQSISDLSLKYGFRNLSSFSRSFKKYYGFAASELKYKTKSQMCTTASGNSKIGKTSVLTRHYIRNVESIKAWMAKNADISVQHIPEVKLAYIRHWGNPYTIHKAYKKLLDWCDKVNYDTHGKSLFTLFHDNPALTEDYKTQQSACIEINTQTTFSQNISVLSIPSQKYLLGKFELADREFELAWNSLIIWMNEMDIRANDGQRFEKFLGNSLFDGDSKYTVEIGIPIL